jgi:hypothetical protein
LKKNILVLIFSFTTAIIAFSQPIILPSIGLQTLTFAVDTGDVLVKKINTLGGNLSGPHNAFRIQAELLLSKSSILRFPFSIEGFFLHGVETIRYQGTPLPPDSKGRFQVNHNAVMFAGNMGIGITWLRLKNIADFYASAEGKVFYIPPSTLSARFYDEATNTDYKTSSNDTHKDTWVRIGTYFKGGIQVPFFEPLMIDFSGGYGMINLLGKNKEAGEHTLFSIDRAVHQPEQTIPYWGLGLSIIYKL